MPTCRNGAPAVSLPGDRTERRHPAEPEPTPQALRGDPDEGAPFEPDVEPRHRDHERPGGDDRERDQHSGQQHGALRHADGLEHRFVLAGEYNDHWLQASLVQPAGPGLDTLEDRYT